MGNNVSSQCESSSGSEESPPAKPWTAARGRREFGPNTPNTCTGASSDQVATSRQSFKSHDSGSKPGRTPTSSAAEKENFKLQTYNPTTPTPVGRKKRLATPELFEEDHFQPKSGAAMKQEAALDTPTKKHTRVPKTPRNRKAYRKTYSTADLSDTSEADDKAGPRKPIDVQDSDSDNELPDLDQLWSRSAESKHRSGSGAKLGKKRTGLACLGCLRRMGSSKPFFGCRNQPGRSDDAPCQDCRESRKGCGNAPAAIKEAARYLQSCWELSGRHRETILRSAWERYARELSEHETKEAERRNGVHKTATSASTSSSTVAATSISTGKSVLSPDPVIPKKRKISMARNARPKEISPDLDINSPQAYNRHLISREALNRPPAATADRICRDPFIADPDDSEVPRQSEPRVPAPYKRGSSHYKAAGSHGSWKKGGNIDQENQPIRGKSPKTVPAMPHGKKSYRLVDSNKFSDKHADAPAASRKAKIPAETEFSPPGPAKAPGEETPEPADADEDPFGADDEILDLRDFIVNDDEGSEYEDFDLDSSNSSEESSESEGAEPESSDSEAAGGCKRAKSTPQSAARKRARR